MFNVGWVSKQQYNVLFGIFGVVVDVDYFGYIYYVSGDVWWCNLGQQSFMYGICGYFIIDNDDVGNVGFFGLVGGDLIMDQMVVYMCKVNYYVVVWVYGFGWCGGFWCCGRCGCRGCFFYWFGFKCFYVFVVGFNC